MHDHISTQQALGPTKLVVVLIPFKNKIILTTIIDANRKKIFEMNEYQRRNATVI